MTVTTEQLATFCAAVVEKCEDHAAKSVPALHALIATTIEAEVGSKYARIVKGEMNRATGLPGSSRSAFCFVDMETGAILKADGWKRPAKHARGNIANGAADVGPYGAAYMR